MPDPDRFFHDETPGAQEWWYFDAISDDGEIALVVVWYAGLPFDPKYGVGTLRHLRNPAKHPAPKALDHAAIGLSVYRGKETIAYALNRYPAARFVHQADPFAVGVGPSQVERSGPGYRLRVETPSADRKRTIVADLTFVPAASTEPVEREIGGRGGPHRWILAAADCQVEGSVALQGPGGWSLDFRGRGYHDHNAGAEDLSVAWTRWRWGRVHLGPRTLVYYKTEPRDGPEQSLLLLLDDGRPVTVVEDAPIRFLDWTRHPLGIRHARSLAVEAGGVSARWTHRDLVDYGPFYLRWLTEYEVDGVRAVGFAELLESKNLHKPWFNWMIPYRLKSVEA